MCFPLFIFSCLILFCLKFPSRVPNISIARSTYFLQLKNFGFVYFSNFFCTSPSSFSCLTLFCLKFPSQISNISIAQVNLFSTVKQFWISVLSLHLFLVLFYFVQNFLYKFQIFQLQKSTNFLQLKRFGFVCFPFFIFFCHIIFV